MVVTFVGANNNDYASRRVQEIQIDTQVHDSNKHQQQQQQQQR
jgi:hypothetical protein